MTTKTQAAPFEITQRFRVDARYLDVPWDEAQEALDIVLEGGIRDLRRAATEAFGNWYVGEPEKPLTEYLVNRG